MKGADNPLFAKMRSILAENIAQYDYDYYFEYISIQEDEIRTALRLIKEKRLKGLIFLGGNYDRKLEDLQQLTVPFVMSTVNIQEEVPRAAFSSVFTDSYQESRRMVEYLCRKGFQKIVIFAGSKNDASVGNLRLKGYLDELAANQIPPDENRIFFSPDQAEDVFTMENGYRMAKKLLQSGIAFDCIYAIADAIAIGACKALLEKGIRIPQECAVAGFDGLDVTRYYHPSITTMRQPIEKMAEESVRILFSRIHKKQKMSIVNSPANCFRGNPQIEKDEKETDGRNTLGCRKIIKRRNEKMNGRGCGILLPVFSLPSPYGIGTLGKEAFAFIDFLERAGQKYWQILPVGPTSYGDSPYQSYSIYAGNPYFIDLDILKEEGLLKQEELPEKEEVSHIDYAELYHTPLWDPAKGF